MKEVKGMKNDVVEEYYYGNIPLRWVVNTAKELCRRLDNEELHEAAYGYSSPFGVHITLNCKNGRQFTVNRKRDWVAAEKRYRETVQVYTRFHDVIAEVSYLRDGFDDEAKVTSLYNLAYRVNVEGR